MLITRSSMESVQVFDLFDTGTASKHAKPNPNQSYLLSCYFMKLYPLSSYHSPWGDILQKSSTVNIIEVLLIL